MQNLNRIFSRYKECFESGENLEVIQEFYDNNIVQVENNDPPVSGKNFLLNLEKENLSKVNVLSQKLEDLVIDENSQNVWGRMIVSFESLNGRKRLEEAFLQKWVNGKIVYQRFFYKGFISE